MINNKQQTKVTPYVITLCLIVVAFAALEYKDIKKIDSIRKYSVDYVSVVDKEKFLVSIYDDVKAIDEEQLPADLRSFVITVKVSQFCK
jgi:hypothetical protein